MKNLFSVSVWVLLVFQASTLQAQCVPNTDIGQAYMYPEKLSNAMAGYYYTQVLTFRVPKDTVVVYQSLTVPATVDSAKVLHIAGIPAGYSLECNNPRCTWVGGTLGCATLMGISDTAGTMVGEYPIKIYVGTWARAASTTFYRIDSNSNYVFRVLAYNGGFELSKFEKLKAFPNPTQDILHIELRDITTSHNIVSVFDLTGKLVYEKTFGKPNGFLQTESVSIGHLPKGLYTVVLQTETATQRLKVQKN